jgi:hypothetical protein
MVNSVRRAPRFLLAASLVGGGLSSFASGCKPPLPPAPEYDTSKGCSSTGFGEPLVVDWKPQHRVDLEAAMKEGVAIVKYDCKSIELVRDCRIEGGYGFMATTTKEEVVKLTSADDVRINLPLSGLKLGADLGADMQRGASLDIALVMVGKKATTWKNVETKDLRGAGCKDATHFIASASIGAFVMQTGSQTQARTAFEMFSVGAGATTSATKSMRNIDGSIDECKKATPDSAAPPGQCGAPLRLELVPILTKAPEKGDRKKDAPAVDVNAVNSCPDGYVFEAGKCTEKAAATGKGGFQCKGTEFKECDTQCQAGNAMSCDLAGIFYRWGNSGGVKQDLALARAYFKKSCEGGAARGCLDFGVSLEHGIGGATEIDSAYSIYKKSCEDGEPIGCTWLGTLYENGSGVNANPEKAMKLYQQGCNGGHEVGCTFLGTLYERGLGLPKDDARAVQLYERGCRGDNGQACSNLASRRDTGRGVMKDELEAYKLHVKGCEHGWGKSCETLGDRYLAGGNSIPPEGRQSSGPEAALVFFKAGCTAARPSPDACGKLGLLFEQGKGVEKDLSLANDIYKKGCETDSGVSCRFLAENVSAGLGVKSDVALAYKIMRRGCELGDLEACRKAAVASYLGDGASVDHAAAAGYWEKACLGGLLSACLPLGTMFENGDGVAKKPEIAAKLYLRACSDEDQRGCVSLGVLYYFGRGVDRDQTKAVSLFQFACNKGDLDACMNVGIMQLQGEGVAKDESRAVETFRGLCDDKNFPKACSTLGYLAKYGKGFAKDPARAVALSDKACRSGALGACTNLATWLEEPPTAKKEDVARAVSLLQKACDGGEWGGCSYLGYMLERGKGVPKDPTRALSLYRKACDKGDAEGCSSLEFVQELGQNGVPASPQLSLGYFTQACTKKDARACSQAGFQHLLGRGTAKNRTKAVEFLRKACAGKVARACDALKSMVEAQLSPTSPGVAGLLPARCPPGPPG